jgi:hypothetical protein
MPEHMAGTAVMQQVSAIAGGRLVATDAITGGMTVGGKHIVPVMAVMAFMLAARRHRMAVRHDTSHQLPAETRREDGEQHHGQ